MTLSTLSQSPASLRTRWKREGPCGLLPLPPKLTSCSTSLCLRLSHIISSGSDMDLAQVLQYLLVLLSLCNEAGAIALAEYLHLHRAACVPAVSETFINVPNTTQKRLASNYAHTERYSRCKQVYAIVVALSKCCSTWLTATSICGQPLAV